MGRRSMRLCMRSRVRRTTKRVSAVLHPCPGRRDVSTPAQTDASRATRSTSPPPYNRAVINRPDMAGPTRGSASDAIADVAVVGGGIVGAAAALASAQAGLATVWVAGRAAFDTMPPGDRDLRVYALSPATRRFLERLRVWSSLDAARIAPVFEMRVYGDRDGSSSLHFDAYEAATERLATIVEHRALSRVLETAAGFFPGIERIDGVATDVVVDDRQVSLATERGTRAARLVVAADGARSATREALGIPVLGRSYGQRAIVGNFACARPHAGAAFQWFTDDGVIALLPLASDGDAPFAVSLVWSAPDAIADRLLADGAESVAVRLSAIVASRADCAIGPLTPLGPLADVPLSVQWASRMIASRAALVGDAAHVIHPLAGQGLNLGLGDVESLIDLLATKPTFRDCGDPVLLRRYERSRAEPVFAMRRMTDGLARLFASERRGLVGLRSVGLRMLDRAKPLKRLLVQQASGGATPFDR